METRELKDICDALGLEGISTGTERNLETGDFISGITLEFKDGKKLYFVAPQQTRAIEPRLILETPE